MPFLSSGQTRTGAPGVSGGTPLYVPNTGNQIAGVLSLNGQAGIVTLSAGDASTTVNTTGGAITVGTNGNPLAPSTVTSSGNVSVGGSLSVTGDATIAGNLVAGFFNTPGLVTGRATIATSIPNGTYVFLTELNNVLSTLQKPVLLVVSFYGTITPVNPSGIPSIIQVAVVPPVNSGSGTGIVAVTGGTVQNLGTQFRITSPGGAGARATLFEVACGAGGGYTINPGSTYEWALLG
jgi:hypothetical protein